MNLDYERNVCFTEATNSGLFTKKKLKGKISLHLDFEKIYGFQKLSRDLISILVSRFTNLIQKNFQIFGKIITRCRLIEIQQNVTFEIEGHFLSIFLRNFSFPVLTEKHNCLG